MKTLLLALLMMACSAAIAAEKKDALTLNLDRVTVVDLVNAVYGDILRQNYAIDPALVDKPDTVTVHFRDSNAEQVAAYMRGLLDSLGMEIVDRPGHILIKPKGPYAGKEIFLYRPKHRSATYIVDLISGLFQGGKFSHQQGEQMGTGNMPSSKASSPMGMVDSSTSPAGSAGDVAVSRKDIDAFVFEGTKVEVERLQKLLAMVDTPMGEVLIKAIVYEVGSTKKEGGATGLALNILGGKLGLSLGKFTNLGDSASFKSATIEAIYSALSSDSRFKVVSSPSLRVKSGGHGLISVGSDVPILSSVSYDNNGRPIQNVKMMPSGVILDLKPSVTEAGVDLVVKQQISSFVQTTTGVNSSPTLIKREISTVVGTSHDEIVILGGLDESKLNSDSSGLPFLPSWMRSSGQEDSKTEILLVLQVQKI